MPELQSYGASQASTRSGRTNRQLTALSNRTDLAVAQRQAIAEVQIAAAAAVSAVTITAVQDVGVITQVEQAVVLITPLASGRAAMLADSGALGLAQIITDTARKVR